MARRTPAPDAAVVAMQLHSAAIHLLRTVRKVDPASGLTPQRLSAMSVVVFGGARTMRDLAAAEQVSVPTMSRLVQALEQEGLLTREVDPDDRRSEHLVATAKGKRLLKQGQDRRLRLVSHILERMPPADFHALARGVPALQQAILGENQ
jgi:DNA-binding MarR family transcriptional regulator